MDNYKTNSYSYGAWFFRKKVLKKKYNYIEQFHADAS